jgi:hypothetical protein
MTLSLCAVNMLGAGEMSEASCVRDAKSPEATSISQASLPEMYFILVVAGSVLVTMLIILFIVRSWIRDPTVVVISQIPASIIDDWEIRRDNVVVMDEIGKGSFGVVYRGVATITTAEGKPRAMAVAVKQLARRCLTKQDYNDFCAEVFVMKILSTPGSDFVSNASHPYHFPPTSHPNSPPHPFRLTPLDFLFRALC